MRFNFAGVFCKTLGFSIQQIVLFSLALSAEVLCGLHLFIEWTFDWVDVHSLFSLLLDKWCVNLLKDCTTGWRSPPPTECSQQVKRSFKTGGTSLLFPLFGLSPTFLVLFPPVLFFSSQFPRKQKSSLSDLSLFFKRTGNEENGI